MKYSKDGKVCFNEEKHTYLLGDKYLQGVTSLISKYKNKFEADLIAERFALKHGLDKDKLLSEWKQKGEASIEVGKAIHKIFETFGLTGNIELQNQHEKEKVAIKFINDFFKTNRLTPVETEAIVYNDSVASQIDMIVKNSIGEYFILDWKTNETIEKNGFNKFMLEPFQCYPDACFYHYSMQLSIYEKLYKEHPIKEKFIVHIGPNNYELIKAEAVIVPESVIKF